MPQGSLDRDYFERIYRGKEDPWNFAGSEYESEKYRETIGILPPGRFSEGLEIGCSIGVQTTMLAEHCDHLLAIDTSELAIERARQRCVSLPNVEFLRMGVPQEYPEGLFDLTVFSEIGYYFAAHDLGKIADTIGAHAGPSGYLLLVHWLLFAPDHPVSGDEVHDMFLARPEWRKVDGLRRDQYRIDLLQRT